MSSFLFSPQTLQEFTDFETFIVPSNLMDQLTDGLRKLLEWGKHRQTLTDTWFHKSSFLRKPG